MKIELKNILGKPEKRRTKKSGRKPSQATIELEKFLKSKEKSIAYPVNIPKGTSEEERKKLITALYHRFNRAIKTKHGQKLVKKYKADNVKATISKNDNEIGFTLEG